MGTYDNFFVMIALYEANQNTTIMQHLKNYQIDLPEAIRIGESNMEEMQFKPIKTSYVAVCVCKQGYGVFNINFKRHLIRKNDIIILYDDSFAMLQAKSRKFRLEYWLIDKKLATEIAYVLPNQLFAFFNDFPVISIPLEKVALFESWRYILLAIVSNWGKYGVLQLKNHLQNLFLEISNHAQHISIKPENKSRQEQLCWRFWDLITTHCKQHKEVKFYAEQLSITPFYLSKISQTFFNDPPKVLIDRQVILEIKALLEIGNLSIKQIADELNFEDTSYLCRYFKRHTGMTLTGFKKRIAQKELKNK
ncbi:helix-turn-helix domain-containing protein [Providencia hangzhouensis]|uniref:helix-turn-helix domain-containing protein n=2 Tax=Providencia TaxID=586 RepID=UPI001FAB9352|nr:MULTISPECIES: helix-turn-helix domain-containing protein [Providencia]WOB93388.1 helix-turn-helix domain-containing protein [Providencia sp. PROV099]